MIDRNTRATIGDGVANLLECARDPEYASCLGEPEFWEVMKIQWQLYVDLGASRQSLSRMAQRELAQIPRDATT